jgi:hypothetical protein
VRTIVSVAPVRRTTQEALDRLAPDIAHLLVATLRLHEWDTRHKYEPRVAVGSVTANRLRKAILIERADAMNPELARLRRELKTAQRRWDKNSHKARSGGSARFKDHCRLLVARIRLEQAMARFNWLRSGFRDPPRKHRLKQQHSAVLHVLGELYYDYGLPDRTISALLTATGLPDFTPRNIKRIRATYLRRRS